MDWKAAARVGIYSLIGLALAVWLLAIPTIPGSHGPSDAFARWRLEREYRPRTLHRDCGWRIAVCEEVPPVSTSIAPSWDSAAAGLDRFSCDFAFVTSCFATKGDTVVSILIDREGGWSVLSRSWAPSDLGVEYDRFQSELSARYGDPHLCPQSDDLAFTEDRKWQVGDRYVGIVKALDSLLQLSTGDGLLVCHVGP